MHREQEEQALEELLARALELIENGDSAELEELLQAGQGLADELRCRLEKLEAFGLSGPLNSSPDDSAEWLGSRALMGASRESLPPYTGVVHRMLRDEAFALLQEMTETKSLLRHARSVEIAMRHQARIHSENEEHWGIAGLLHDADYEKWPDEHPNRIVALLRERGEEELAHAISAHYTKWNVEYTTLLSKALVATDELTGFIVACSLVRPEGIRTLEPKSVKKKFKDRSFAAKVEREEITKALEIYGVDFADQVREIIAALRLHAEELGIGGKQG